MQTTDRRLVTPAIAVAALLLGLAIGAIVGQDGDPAADAPAVEDVNETDDLAPIPVNPGHADPETLVAGLVAAGLRPPSDCPFPSGNPEFLPGSPRGYRSGVHMGLDLFCRERGHDAVAALPGRVVVATHGWREPSAEAREALLEDAARLGATPPWTLVLLYGRHVVVDHGVVDGVGHVVTIYAHLAAIDADIVPGVEVAAGHRLGEIGFSGTETAATGENDPDLLHLHWEITVDDVPLGAGLTTDETGPLYEALLGAGESER